MVAIVSFQSCVLQSLLLSCFLCEETIPLTFVTIDSQGLQSESLQDEIVVVQPCSSLVCTGTSEYSPKRNIQAYTCKAMPCTKPECCDQHPSCMNRGSSFSACGVGYHLKGALSSIFCSSSTCTRADCCDLNPQCPSSFTCPAGLFHIKPSFPSE